MDEAIDVMNHGQTHWAGCYRDHPKHWRCALEEIDRLHALVQSLEDRLTEINE